MTDGFSDLLLREGSLYCVCSVHSWNNLSVSFRLPWSLSRLGTEATIWCCFIPPYLRRSEVHAFAWMVLLHPAVLLIQHRLAGVPADRVLARQQLATDYANAAERRSTIFATTRTARRRRRCTQPSSTIRLLVAGMAQLMRHGLGFSADNFLKLGCCNNIKAEERGHLVALLARTVPACKHEAAGSQRVAGRAGPHGAGGVGDETEPKGAEEGQQAAAAGQC